MLEWLLLTGSIILIDVTLSSDNALIIGATVTHLPRPERWIAMICGGSGAVILRILFTFLASALLRLPFLKAISGLVLFVIAVRFLLSRDKELAQTRKETAVSPTILSAFVTILLADVTTSLDNILAISALANGNMLLLTVGLCISIGCILVASAIIATLVARLPFLLNAVAFILGWTAAHLVLDEKHLHPLLVQLPLIHITLPVLALVILLVVYVFSRRKPVFVSFQRQTD